MTQEKNTPAADLPAGVYYSPEADNFYGVQTSHGMGMAFWSKWRARKHEFPTKAEITTTPPPALEGGSRTPRDAPQPDILPCPFCGSDAYTEGKDGEGFFVGCRNCYCNVGEAYDHSAMPEHMFVTEEEAIAAWNRRAEQKATGGDTRGEANPSPPPQEGLVEALEEAESALDALSDYDGCSRGAKMVAKDALKSTRRALSHHRAGVKT